MRHGWWLWEAEIPSEDVDKIVEKCKQLETLDATIGGGNYSDAVRVTDVAFVEDEEIDKMVMHYVNKANDYAFGFDIDQKNVVQFGEYNAGGFFEWHLDNNYINDRFFDRKLTFLMMLSDESEYQGGDFEIKINGEETRVDVLKRKGSIIVFPSFFEHRVTPVTSGVRRTLASWVSGPNFK